MVRVIRNVRVMLGSPDGHFTDMSSFRRSLWLWNSEVHNLFRLGLTPCNFRG